MGRRTELGLWAGLIVVAVLAGLGIAGMPELGAGPEPDRVATPSTAPDPAESAATTTTTPPSTTASTTSSTTSTTTPEPELRPAAEVTVLVLNGTRVAGAAGRLTDTLGEEGHPTLTPTSTAAYDASEVWFTGDYGPEAAELAERLGVFPENVMVMPADVDITVGSADVIVVVGPDLAEDV